MDDTPQPDHEFVNVVRNALDAHNRRHDDLEARLARLEAQVTALVQAQHDLRRTVQAAITRLSQTLGETTETTIFLDIDPEVHP